MPGFLFYPKSQGREFQGFPVSGIPGISSLGNSRDFQSREFQGFSVSGIPNHQAPAAYADPGAPLHLVRTSLCLSGCFVDASGVLRSVEGEALAGPDGRPIMLIGKSTVSLPPPITATKMATYVFSAYCLTRNLDLHSTSCKPL